MNRVKHHGRVSDRAKAEAITDLMGTIRHLQGEVHGLESQLGKTMDLLTESERERNRVVNDLHATRSTLDEWSRIRTGRYVTDSYSPKLVVTARLTAQPVRGFGDEAGSVPERQRIKQERMEKATPIIDLAFQSAMQQVTRTITEVCKGIMVEGTLDWGAEEADSQSAL
jgi:hypothetical protein